jgi:hypothetical protein
VSDIDCLDVPFGSLFSNLDKAAERSQKKKLKKQLESTFEDKFLKDNSYLQFKQDKRWEKLDHSLLESLLKLYIFYARDSFFLKFFGFLTLDVLEKASFLDPHVLALDCAHFASDLIHSSVLTDKGDWDQTDRMTDVHANQVAEKLNRWFDSDNDQIVYTPKGIPCRYNGGQWRVFQNYLMGVSEILLEKLLLNKAILVTAQQHLFGKLPPEKLGSPMRRWLEDLRTFSTKHCENISCCGHRLVSPSLLKRALLTETPFAHMAGFAQITSELLYWSPIDCLVLVTQRKWATDANFEDPRLTTDPYHFKASKDRVFLPMWSNQIKKAGPLDVDWIRTELATGYSDHGYNRSLRSPLFEAFEDKLAKKEYARLKKKIREARKQKPNKGDPEVDKKEEEKKKRTLKMQKYAYRTWSNLVLLSEGWGKAFAQTDSWTNHGGYGHFPKNQTCTTKDCLQCDKDAAIFIRASLVTTHNVCQLSILGAEDVARKLASPPVLSTIEEAEKVLASKTYGQDEDVLMNCISREEANRPKPKKNHVSLDLRENGKGSKRAWSDSSDDSEDTQRNDDNDDNDDVDEDSEIRAYVDSELDEIDGDDEEDDDYSPESKFEMGTAMCGKTWNKEYKVPKYNWEEGSFESPEEGDLGVANSEDGSSCEEEDDDEEDEVYSDEDRKDPGVIEPEDQSTPEIKTRTRRVKAVRNWKKAEERVIERMYYTDQEYEEILKKEQFTQEGKKAFLDFAEKSEKKQVDQKRGDLESKRKRTEKKEKNKRPTKKQKPSTSSILGTKNKATDEKKKKGKTKGDKSNKVDDFDLNLLLKPLPSSSKKGLGDSTALISTAPRSSSSFPDSTESLSGSKKQKKGKSGLRTRNVFSSSSSLTNIQVNVMGENCIAYADKVLMV